VEAVVVVETEPVAEVLVVAATVRFIMELKEQLVAQILAVEVVVEVMEHPLISQVVLVLL
jgi:hypothetical protein